MDRRTRLHEEGSAGLGRLAFLDLLLDMEKNGDIDLDDIQEEVIEFFLQHVQWSNQGKNENSLLEIRKMKIFYLIFPLMFLPKTKKISKKLTKMIFGKNL